MTPPHDSDIKIMLPREWDEALLKAQGAALERTTTAYVKSLVERDLKARGFLPPPSPAGEVAGEADQSSAAATA